MKRALITGVLGQDGSYLAEHLLSLGYEVHGTIRMHDMFCKYLDKLPIHYYYADMRDEMSLEKAIRKCHPDEIYNLAGQVFVPTSWDYPAETFDVNVGGLARILKIVEAVCPTAHVYQASTSEMYGNVLSDQFQVALDERSRMQPVSPYGVSKLAAHKLVDVYRQKGLFIVSGILFNHESPRRGREMVTRKITQHIAKWTTGDRTTLHLGNIKARRDWGFAGDFVKAMWAMLQQDKPDDYVIGTGKSFSVEDFIDHAVRAAKLSQGHRFLVVPNSHEFIRPAELHCLIADCSKAHNQLGWYPEHTFPDLVEMMVKADIDELASLNSVVRV